MIAVGAEQLDNVGHLATGFMLVFVRVGALLMGTPVFRSTGMPTKIRLMLALIVSAIQAVRSRNFLGHGAAMARAYAIGQGASTQTFLGIGWMVVYGEESSGLSRDVLMTAGWLEAPDVMRLEKPEPVSVRK